MAGFLKKQRNRRDPAEPHNESKKHSFIIVIVLAAVIFFAGSLIGMGMVKPFQILCGTKFPEIQFLLEYYLFYIGLDILIVLFCYFRERKIFDSMRSQRKGGMRGNNLKFVLLGLGIGFGTNTICVGCAVLSKDVTLAWNGISPLFLVLAFAAVLIQSGAEELVTRGYILGALNQRYPVWVGVLANGLFFGALHVLNPGVTVISVLNIFLFGVTTALAVSYYDCLWLCIALHTAWNFTQNLIYGLPNSGVVSKASVLSLESAGSSFVYEASFGVEGGLVWTILECIALILLLLWGPAAGMRNKKAE